MKLEGILEHFKKRGVCDEWRCGASKDGCNVWRLQAQDERYAVDFAEDFTSEGWLQFDTDQDAWYFGQWVNPRLFITLGYAEGDWSLCECHDRDRYNREIRRKIDFYGVGQIATVIGEAGDVIVYHQDRSEFLIPETAS